MSNIKLKKFKVTILLNGMERSLYGSRGKYGIKRVIEEVGVYLSKMEEGTDLGVVSVKVKEVKNADKELA